MRPLKLTMNAFGPYSGKQMIDFTKLGANGLYLITGETGSGKTTIFDAISFALFGKASGAARDDYYMLRSDFADEKTKTYVELDFISGNNRYNIKRTVKKTGQEAVLTLPDGTAMSGDRNVRAKISEVVGLDRSQFAQIVMIAQNDFLRFLQSGTDERLKILRRIFGTEALRQFQERLKALVKRENDKRMLIFHDFGRYGVDIYKREEQFSQWEEQIRADKAKLSEMESRLSEYDKCKQTLAAKLAVAEELCKKLDELAALRLELEIHTAGASEIAAAKARAARGETALRRLKPLAREAQKAARARSEAQIDLNEARQQEAAAKLDYESAGAQIEALPPLSRAREEFAAFLREWEIAAEKLKRVTALRVNLIEIKGKRDTLVKMQKEFEILNSGFVESDKKYRIMEEAFLRAQAGIIAGSLVDGIPCPVCGSTEHPLPASLSESVVTEAGLKSAREAKNKEQIKREAKASQCASLKTEIETLTRRFAADFSELAGMPLVPDTDWGDIEKEFTVFLAKAQDRADRLENVKESSKQKLDALSESWNRADERKANAEAAVKSARTLVLERAANVQKLERLCSETDLSYSEALRKNGFADEEEYKNALVTEDELTRLTEQISGYERSGERLVRDVARLESETAGEKRSDVKLLREELENVSFESKALGGERDKTNSRLNEIENALKELSRAASCFEKAEKAYASIKQLADTANGKTDFETYAQMAYFERVIRAANLRLRIMSQNRFTLLRKTEGDDGRKRAGLELEVLDAYTGKARSAKSLSGGESFMASLSLALGLSDIVQQSAGGIRLDAMFIDEGFGSLDSDVLELAIRTLSEMAGASRIIGIISHVAELRERIDRQIRVEKTAAGSKINLAL